MGKSVEQNVVIESRGRKMKVQFNFCPECQYFEACYRDNNDAPYYIGPECFDEGRELGYDV